MEWIKQKKKKKNVFILFSFLFLLLLSYIQFIHFFHIEFDFSLVFFLISVSFSSNYDKIRIWQRWMTQLVWIETKERKKKMSSVTWNIMRRKKIGFHFSIDDYGWTQKQMARNNNNNNKFFRYSLFFSTLNKVYYQRFVGVICLLASPGFLFQ